MTNKITSTINPTNNTKEHKVSNKELTDTQWAEWMASAIEQDKMLEFAAFRQIIAVLDKRCTVGKETRRFLTFVNRNTLEHRPNAAQKAKIAQRDILRSTQGARERQRQILAEKDEQRKAEEKAKRTEKVKTDPMAAMWEAFSKQLSTEQNA